MERLVGGLCKFWNLTHYMHAYTRQFIRCPYRCLSAVFLPKNWYHSITTDYTLIDCNPTTNNNSYYPMKFNNNDLKRTSNHGVPGLSAGWHHNIEKIVRLSRTFGDKNSGKYGIDIRLFNDISTSGGCHLHQLTTSYLLREAPLILHSQKFTHNFPNSCRTNRLML